MKTCENCNEAHNGEHGSGRFCSLSCSRSFSTKNKRKEINKKIKLKLTGINNHTGQKALIHNLQCICGVKFIVDHNHRDQIYCSVKCARLNKKHPLLSERTKIKISKSVKKTYDNGKRVYGGWTKWIEVETSIGKIKVQGTFELRTCKILDCWKNVGKIKNWEYTNDRIKYIGVDKKEHNYLLDFKIIENDGSYWYLEIKGYEVLNDKLKWNETVKQGHKLKIWFNKNLKEEESKLTASIPPFL